MNADDTAVIADMGGCVKHTQGPWKATYRGAGGWAISNTVWVEYLRDARLTKTDAKLIAAVPELLRLLTILCQTRGSKDRSYTTAEEELAWKQAHAALLELGKP